MIIKKTDFNPPVWIKRVKIKNRNVPLDKKFEEDDDWLRGFTVTVFNASNKTVTHVGLEMLFRRAKPSTLPPAAWHLEYGPNPFHRTANDSTPPSTVPPVITGGEIELKLGDDELTNLTDFLTAAGFDDKIHSVEIRIMSIGFADGTAWFGKMVRPDPTSPSKWRVEHPAGGAARKPQQKYDLKSLDPAANLTTAKKGSETPSLNNHAWQNPPIECGDNLGIQLHCDSSEGLPENCVYSSVQSNFSVNPQEKQEFVQVQCRLVVGGSSGANCGGVVWSQRAVYCEACPTLACDDPGGVSANWCSGCPEDYYRIGDCCYADCIQPICDPPTPSA